MKTWFKRILYTFCVACRPHTSRTVRVAFPLLLISIGLLGASTIVSEDSSYLMLNPSVNTLKEGEPFSIDVHVFAHEPINAIDITIAYPKEQVDVTAIDTGQSVITLWTEDPYIEDNTAHLRGGTFRKGFLGDHFIARIDAVAKQSGIANISAESVKLLAGDGAGTEIELSENAGQNNVQIRIANENGEIRGDVSVVRVLTDIDGDGVVNLKDISMFMAAWFSRDVLYDFSGDNSMTFKDFSIILAESFKY